MRQSNPAKIEIPGLDVPKAKRYSRTRLAVLLLSTCWSIVQLAWFASDHRGARLRSTTERLVGRRFAAPAFFATVFTFSWLANLPVDYAGGYRVERRYGLTRQPAGSWLADKVKGLVVGLAIQTPLLTVVYRVIRQRPRDWWLVLSGAAVPLSVVFSHLAPVLLMPVFNRFVPLQNRELANRVRDLAAGAGISVSDVYEMDMSRQSEKPNAMFTGIGNTRRIVLGDTLLERFAVDEIEAVVAHEIGHQVHGDIWRLIGFGAGSGFGLAWLMARVAPTLVRRTSQQTGVGEIGEEASLPLLAGLMTVFGVILMPISAAFSRAMERRTDAYAMALTGNGDAYARAMERLAAQSLADPDPPRPVVFMLYSHPPIAERIRAAREQAAGAGAGERPATKVLQRG